MSRSGGSKLFKVHLPITNQCFKGHEMGLDVPIKSIKLISEHKQKQYAKMIKKSNDSIAAAAKVSSS